MVRWAPINIGITKMRASGSFISFGVNASFPVSGMTTRFNDCSERFDPRVKVREGKAGMAEARVLNEDLIKLLRPYLTLIKTL